MDPSSSSTSTSTVGLPRESRISRAARASIVGTGGLLGGEADRARAYRRATHRPGCPAARRRGRGRRQEDASLRRTLAPRHTTGGNPMRTRLILAAGAAAAVAVAALPSQAAGAKVLDGKKTKTLSFSVATSPQDNDTNFVTDLTDIVATTPVSRPDMANCPATRCLSYSF